MNGINYPAWMGDALCAQTDPALFFVEKGGSNRPGKSICTKCPVRDECLQYALDNDEPFGLFGGMTVNERRATRKAAA